ncbi:glycosyl transferase family group 2-domain-containing protein [Elsinoe ampelina]|uniref:Glycosyl transferase family group 2-domain-containing protein n=1 Tax=Elsinoe ampelina TaxID=302913 RepID=A0A6A6GAF5_9PEZI|nr:glycosyl transferase family group 2-domain-containing protein [Elsinoe ampelina]
MRSNSTSVTVSAPIMEKSTAFSSSKRFEVMAKFLHQRLQQSKWLEEYHENMYFGTANLGAFVRRPDGSYAKTTQNPAVLKAVETISATVAFTMSCDSVSVLMETLEKDQTEVPFMDGTSLLIAPSVTDVINNGMYAHQGHMSVLCKREHFILICASSPPELLAQATALEAHLVGEIWGQPIMAPPAPAYNPVDFVPRSNSVPNVNMMPVSFGDHPDLSLHPSVQRNMSVGDASHMTRPTSAYVQPMYQTHQNNQGFQNFQFGQPQQQQLMPPQRRPSTDVYGHSRSVSNTTINYFSKAAAKELASSTSMPVLPMPIHKMSRRSSMADPFAQHKMSTVDSLSAMNSRRMNSVADYAARKMSTIDPFHKSESSKGPSRSQSVSGPDRRKSTSGHNRSSSAGAGGAMRQSSTTSIGSVPEDEVPEMAQFPRRPSMAKARNSSVSSTYMGGYRGSVSHDIEKMVQFVERAMELEEEGPEDEVRQRDMPRVFLLEHACCVAIAGGLVCVLQVWCAAKLMQQWRLDGGCLRWALLATIPFFAAFSMFFMVVIAGSFFQIFGPLGFMQKNTVYYSSKAPKFTEHDGEELPHITIQMPVYKEGLKGVIVPTITSVLKAVNYYQAHGGTATIMVADDGMQLITEELQEARKVFYELHNIAWVARPKQCTTPGPDFFLRKGKFKKASNLNYALHFSGRVEDEFLEQLEKRAKEQLCTVEDLSVEDEEELLEVARQIVEETDNGRTWSAGDVRIGEFILLIDSDTQVPETCLLAGALELMESPEVAIIQHSSGVMNMTGNPFENGIHYFTDLVYTSISHTVGAGDVAPFVGHNAFLRWKAIQSIAFEEDGRTKFWSENHVSEDFDVALRLQMQHFYVRMAGYHNNEFKEGVSLTIYDELARWEKYAYGCNELIFNPLIYWPTRGLFTPLFLRFLGSNIKITSKFTILAYIGTYYAIGVGFPLSLLNYFLAGWEFQLDQYYQTSWHIFVGLCIVYSILSPIAFAMLRYRMGQATYIEALCTCAKWMPLFILFFGGLSFHICKALTCHFLSINIEWTTTAKELEKTGFKIGLDRVVRDFWHMYVVMIPIAAMMVYLALYAPRGYMIRDFTVIVPLANAVGCHALLPFVLGLF